MTMIPSAVTPHFDFRGTRFTGLAAPSRGACETAVWRVRIPGGTGAGTTHQLSREEILVALSGSAVARIGDASHPFTAGDAVIVPAFTDFTLDVEGAEPFEAVAVLPVGGRVILPGTAPFTPAWAQ